jgi:hypothetical protein
MPGAKFNTFVVTLFLSVVSVYLVSNSKNVEKRQDSRFLVFFFTAS